METLFNGGFNAPVKTTKYALHAVMSLRDYIDNNPFQFKASSELLDHLNTPNRSLIEKAFKNQFGVGIKRYMVKTRLMRAKYYLTQDIPKKIVSHRCLYESVSSFDTAFKKEFGMTPTQWEQLYLAEKAAQKKSKK